MKSENIMKSTAKFILSKNRALAQYNMIKQLSDEVSYSYKTNFQVGQLLKEMTDCSFSVHSVESVDQLKCSNRVW